MGKEIERKFLVISSEWRGLAKGVECVQGYLSSTQNLTVRVRKIGSRAFITIKGVAKSITRAEYEYEIPIADADEILINLCEKPLIEKIRYKIVYNGLVWEVDEFKKENEGLIIAEVELKNENQEICLPPWVGIEVTGDPKYFNSNLVKNPFTRWKRL